MIDIKRLRKDPDFYKRASRAKGLNCDEIINTLLQLDKKERTVLNKLNQLRMDLKKRSRQKPSEREREELQVLKREIQSLEEQYQELSEEKQSFLIQIPNPPLEDVRIGVGERENEVVEIHGKKPTFSFPPRDYLTLSEKLDIIDVRRAGKVSGSRFGYLKNEAALLEIALVQYTWERLVIQEKFIPLIPPVMISEKAMRGMGYLEHGGEKETYHLEKDHLYLVGTSEQSIGPYHMDEIFNEEDLPLRYTAFSNCFRREAGSYGRDTRGILRVHQFDKIEMFVFCRPEDSEKEHQKLLQLQTELMDDLGLHYRVVRLCSGELGKPSAKTYDIETWMPSEQKYRETHSTSNTTDYQARRLNIRYKNKLTGKNEFVFTLNGTAFAIGRMLIMLIENFQRQDGSIAIPEVLQPYCYGKKVIQK